MEVTHSVKTKQIETMHTIKLQVQQFWGHAVVMNVKLHVQQPPYNDYKLQDQQAHAYSQSLGRSTHLHW